MKYIFIFACLMFSASVVAQVSSKLSKAAVLEDLRYLQVAVRDGHPSNYQPRRQVDLDRVVDNAAALPSDSLTAFRFRMLVGEALQEVGCIHTSVRKDPLAFYPDSARFFPYQLDFSPKGGMVIVAPVNSSFLGKTILSVNGVAGNELADYLSQYLAGDGDGGAYPRAVAGLYSSSLIARYFDFPATYTIVTNEREFRLEAAPQRVVKQASAFPFDTITSGEQFLFGVKDSIGLLRINKFSSKDKAAYPELFKQLAEDNLCKSLVIDLRGNGGGDRKTTVNLTRELIDQPFSYSLLKPRLKSSKYLTGKGKFFLLLGQLKYGVGGFYRGRKTDYGRAYRFSYSARKRSFAGPVVVLTDGFTASSATMLTTWLKQHREVTIIGEQAGGGYNGNNGGSFPMLTLPNSGIEIRFPAYRLVMDENSDDRDGIIPDVVLKPTVQELRNRRDAVLEYALKVIILGADRNIDRPQNP